MPDTAKQVDFVVAAYNAEMQGTAMKVAGLIRRGGATVDVLLEPKKKVRPPPRWSREQRECADIPTSAACCQAGASARCPALFSKGLLEGDAGASLDESSHGLAT